MTEMKKHIYDENNGLWYELIGDYYIPVLALSSEEQRPIGKWGRMHREYLKEHHPILFNDLILSDRLWTYLADLNEQAQEARDSNGAIPCDGQRQSGAAGPLPFHR